MKNIYASMYDNRDPGILNSSRIHKMVSIFEKLNLKNGKVLDIGCCDGSFISLLNKNNKYYGIEASDYGCLKASKKGISVIKFFFDDKTPLPHKKNQFDVVIIGEIIEHIYDTDYFLEEIYRVLKPDGLVLLSTPNIASLGRRIMLLFGISPNIEISPNENTSVGHIRYFTFKTLKAFMKKKHFIPIHLVSDVVNFTIHGKFHSKIIARLFPTIGASIIGVFKKEKIK